MSKSDVIIDRVMDEALDAALNPVLVDELELTWEKFLDEALPDETAKKIRLQNSIARAIQILNRLESSSKVFKSAQEIVDSNPGIGLIVDTNFRIVAENSDALGLNEREYVLDGIGKWIAKNSNNQTANFFFSEYYTDNEEPKVLLTTKIFLPYDPQTYFFVTELDILLDDRILEQIISAFRLTRAEAEVCILLSNGLKPAEIANKRKVSIHTVRAQIRLQLKRLEQKIQPI